MATWVLNFWAFGRKDLRRLIEALISAVALKVLKSTPFRIFFNFFWSKFFCPIGKFIGFYREERGVKIFLRCFGLNTSTSLYLAGSGVKTFNLSAENMRLFDPLDQSAENRFLSSCAILYWKNGFTSKFNFLVGKLVLAAD